MNPDQIRLIVGIGILSYCLYQSYWLTVYIRRIRNSKAWPTVTGIVTSASTASSAGDLRGRNYWADICYSYTVLGSEYSGKFMLGSFGGSRQTAEENAGKFSTGSTFPVYFNPDKPHECATEFEKINFRRLITILFFWILGIFLIYTFVSH